MKTQCAILLGACVVANSHANIVPIGDNSYRVTLLPTSEFHSKEVLKQQALNLASHHCDTVSPIIRKESVVIKNYLDKNPTSELIRVEMDFSCALNQTTGG